MTLDPTKLAGVRSASERYVKASAAGDYDAVAAALESYGVLASPPFVIALCDEIERAQSEAARWRERAEELGDIVRQGLAVIDSPAFRALAERNAGALLMYNGPRLDVEAARSALSSQTQGGE